MTDGGLKLPPIVCSATLGLWFSLCGSVLIASNYITGKYALKTFNIVTFSLIWAAAAAVFSSLSLLKNHAWRETFNLTGMARRALLAVGFLTSVGMVFTWLGLDSIDPSLVAFLMRFAPLMAIGLGRVYLRDRFGRMELIPIGLMVFGSLLSAAGRWQAVGPGIFYCLIACGAIAGQTFICRLFVHSCGPRVLVFFRSLGAAAFIFIWALMSGRLDFIAPIEVYSAVILGALVSPVMGQLLLFRSYLYWPFSRSMVIYTSQPLFVALFSWALLSLLPDLQGFLSGSLIMIGSLWFSWINMRKTEGISA